MSNKLKINNDLELAKAAVKLRDESDIPIVGFDIAGSEWGYPADEHKQSYDYVHKHFLHKTVHAGGEHGKRRAQQIDAQVFVCIDIGRFTCAEEKHDRLSEEKAQHHQQQRGSAQQ